jgi:hypothetical protein
MILPTKRLSVGRSILAIGAELLRLLNEPKTVSRLWDELQHSLAERHGKTTITYDWFVLALDLLYMINAVNYERGRIHKVVT